MAATGQRPAGQLVLAILPGLGNSFWSPIINAVEETLEEAGHGVVFGDLRNDPSREAHFAPLIRSGEIGGALVFSGRLPLESEVLREIGLPIVLVCNDIPGRREHPVFEVANRDAARTMVGHLVGLGHRRIAHVVGSASSIESDERRRGYVDALSAAGIPVDPELVWPGSFAFVAGERAARRFLAMTERPTAIFAASDEVAIGLMGALDAAGVRVPDDVSVAGFDGIDYSAMFNPPLTTMMQPRAELGRRAAEHIARMMQGGVPPGPPAHIRLPCTLVVRESTAPPPGASL